MNFFVIGLPRSRTAWMANFLTYDRFCYHEGLNGCRSIKEYKEKLGSNRGDSSTGLMLIDVEKEFPDAPILIIEIDPDRAIDFASSHGVSPEMVYDMQLRMDYIKGMRVSLSDIDNRLDEIWEYLIGTPFDYDRANLLKSLNVQVQDVFNFDTEAAQCLFESLN